MPSLALNVRSPIGIGKKKERSQMCLVATADGRLVPTEIAVNRGCMQDDKTERAYLIDGNNQYASSSGNEWTQILHESSKIPCCSITPIENVDELNKNCDKIYHEAYEGAMLANYKKAGVSWFMEKLTTIVIVVVIGLLVMKWLTR